LQHAVITRVGNTQVADEVDRNAQWSIQSSVADATIVWHICCRIGLTDDDIGGCAVLKSRRIRQTHYTVVAEVGNENSATELVYRHIIWLFEA